MGTTPVFGFPYPDPSDLVANYPALGQQLAEDVEDEILAASGLALISEQTFTSVSAVNFTSQLSAAYRNYKLVFYSNNSGSMRLRLRSASTDDSSSNYDGAGRFMGTANADFSDSAQTSWRVADSANTTLNMMTSEILSPFIAEPTTAFIQSWQSSPGSNLYSFVASANHRAFTSFDGISVILGGAGSFTGRAKLYGYKGA